ncbi:MAG TPA: twin-arginine translocase subunit TatC [Gemmatimonadales bacterium]
MTARGEMPFLDHLEELRWRILWSLLAIVAGTVLGWFLLDKIDLIELLKRPIAPYLPGGRLVFTSPAEPFMLTLKVAFALGCLVASPLVIYHIWAFLAPALYDREKRLIIPALGVGVVLFLAGGVACYRWLLPAALKVLIGFSRSDLTPMITIDRYFAMAVPFVVGCGLVAELPLVVTILASLGIVTPQFLGRQRRYAVVIAAFLAAILTPPDAVSMMLMLIPLLLLYEISIWCAWVASRRRARRMAAATLVFLLISAGSLRAQNPPPAPPPPPAQRVERDTGAVVKPPGAPGDTGRRGSLDTATARKQGLPTGPSRSFPPTDPVMDSLLKLQGYRLTRYMADTFVVVGDSQTILLRHEAYVEREGTQLQADSIRYREASCRLDATGDPQLFDQGTVLVGEGMRYDTCRHRGTVRDALTDFQQGGVTWYVTGEAFANDSNSRRVYASKAAFTSDPQPVPDYHFAAGQVKWINKRTMVARPAVLYVRDVPIMWLPFIFQDIRGGRRSGILFPRFGINDLVRPSRHYTRHISDFGYYFAVNDYLDVLVAGDWFSGRYVQVHSQAQYHIISRFMNGQLSYTRMQELDNPGVNTTIGWNHSQQFSSRSSLNANVLYATDGRLVQRNSTNPWEVVARMNSTLNFQRRFSWGTLNVGGSRSQDLSSNNVAQTFPTINLTPSSVNITPWMTWSPAFSFTNDMQFHQPAPSLLIPAPPTDTVPLDTLHLFNDVRRTLMTFSTPLRIGRWNWANNLQVTDGRTRGRQEFSLPDSTGAVHRVVYGETFETRVDWQTGINLPSFFSSTWKLQPGVAIVNATSAGPFMIRNQFTGGEFVRQGKRLAFSASVTPTFFGFFPGFGPFSRIRHSFSPQVSWQYAPAVAVPKDFAQALDPSGRTVNLHSDPQQTISVQLSQSFEAKVKPAAGDTTAEQDVRKVKLLSIQTSAIGYNFEAAKLPHRTGWQDAQLRNSFLSDLLPSFQLSITHDLWKGDVGTDSAKFDPFLSSVSASFTVTPATLQGIGRMFGLRPHQEQTARPDTTTQRDTLSQQAGNFRRYSENTRVPYSPRGTGAGMMGAGRGFSLGVSLSSSRSRNDTTPQLRNVPGRRTAALNMSFTPTRNWTGTWSTNFDMATRQFTYHQLTFQRDLRRWRASFSFSRTATGNFSFSFNITLTDQPDIKFDYDQNTYVR